MGVLISPLWYIMPSTPYILTFSIAQVAIKNFIDNYGNLTIEKCLKQHLRYVYTPETVDTLDDRVVELIASEDENTRFERARLEEKLVTLRESLDKLHRLDRHNLPGRV